MKQLKVVILFSRLSDYMLNTFAHYVKFNNVELHIFKKTPDSKQAPFQFDLNIKNIYFYNQEDYNKSTLLLLITDLNPNLILCSGWANPTYNYIINHNYKIINCVLTMDNQWHASLKQYVGILYSRCAIAPKYKKIWLPGQPQEKYARKLGFKKKDIIKGWYVANEKKFFKNRETIKHEFLFVGRYVKYKGILELWRAFIKLKKDTPNDWKLTCIGTGELFGQRYKHPDINHLGFLQPDDLQNYTNNGGVFVLPSHFEPWGVVVHEFALSGFPLLVSDKVGAASQFVDNDNGIIFKSNNEIAIYKAMKKIINLSDEKLIKMGKTSQINAKSISVKTWANNMNKIMNN